MEKRKILIYECIMNILKKIYIARFFLEDNKNYNYWTLYEHFVGNLQEYEELLGGCLIVKN